jgi:carbon-monoxide dehydrogenase medium subunit
MYRVLKPFEYFEPSTVAEATTILSQYGNRAEPLAGGVDLIPKMRRREKEPECIVNLQRIEGLDYVEGAADIGLKLGALASLRTVELQPAVARDYTALYEAVHQIASFQAKSMGTLVGNLCVATPASDVATALLALGASLKIAGPGQVREIPIEGFFTGPGEAVLGPDELVTEVLIPAIQAGTGSAFLNLSKTKADIAKVSVAVTITVMNDTCQNAKIGLGAVAPTPIRCQRAETILAGQKLDADVKERAAGAAAEACAPITDIRSEAEYRREMTLVLVRRALDKALERSRS